MLYNAYISYKDSGGRFKNLTKAPTVTAYKGSDKSVIPGAVIENISAGIYKVSVDYAGLVDTILIKVIPHNDDLNDFADVLVVSGDTVYNSLKGEVLTSLASNVWSYPVRNLTTGVVGVEYPASSVPLVVYKDTTIRISLSKLGNVVGNDKIWFTVKEDVSEPDDEAIIQIDNDTGLLYLNREVPLTAGYGEIDFTDETMGNCVIKLDERATADLPIYSAYSLFWDIKMLKAGVVSILATGEIRILGTPTRAIS